MTAHTPGPFGFMGPSRPSGDAPEGGDFAVTKDGEVIAEFFARSSPTHTWPAKLNAELYMDAPAAKLALEMICAGVARIEGGGFHFAELSFEIGVVRWSAMLDVIGWSRAREALAATRGSV